MNTISNRQVICDTLLENAKEDSNIVVITSDSRGSASMTEFAKQFPEQFVETGIAEQNMVGIGAGLALCGKKPFVASPACFLSMRSIEQIKVDVAYSRSPVRLIGISGGISYGALGMTHHSLQDIAVMRAIPNISVVIPADRFETKKMTQALVDNNIPIYVRIGRNPVEDVFTDENYEFKIGKAVKMREGNDICIITFGETVKAAIDASDELKKMGIGCRVLNMHTLKPLDEEAIIEAAKQTGRIITIEEHSIYGGLGAAVCEVTSKHCPVRVEILGIPDEPAIAGKSSEVFAYYLMDKESIEKVAIKMLSEK